MVPVALLGLWLSLLLVDQQVDSRLCAGCHSQIARDYQQTGMGRSMYRPAAGNVAEFYHALSDTHYAMTVRGGSSYQRRWQIGFDGKETNAEELRIDYVIGSGNHARSYFHRTDRGTLIELPLGWYAEKGGTWGMGPGFDSLHPATRRLASYECVFCHTAYPRIPANHDKPGSEPLFNEDLPQGIDCQRCHGPGGNHIATAGTAGATREQIRSSIVNPARLNPKLRMDLCMQCHLEPTSTAIPSVIRRFDRAPFSFLPGEPLEAFLLTFDHAKGTKHEDKFEIVGSSAYRLRQSRCFLESKGALTCETCHDPHRIPRGEEAEQHYSSACRQCHAGNLGAQHPAADRCTGCHMPKRRTEDVVHVAMTDHLIQRRPPGGDLLAERAERHPSEAEEYHGEVVSYYPAKADALYQALAQVAQNNNLHQGVAQLDRLVALQRPREPEWYLQLGDAWLADGQPVKAVAAYEQAVHFEPQSVRALQQWAKGLKAAGQIQRSNEVLRRAIQIDPNDARSWYQLGEIEKAAALDPDLPGVYTTLASQRRDGAEAALREALRIDPYDAAAWDLSGRLLAEKSLPAEAFFQFEKALHYRPDFGPYFYDYALALASDGQFNRAEETAEAAARADPKLAEPQALLGRILSRKGKLAEAAEHYRTAARLNPDFMQARLDLASVLLAQHQLGPALEELRAVAKGKDPAAARIALDGINKLLSKRTESGAKY